MADNRIDLPPVNSANFLEKLREFASTYLGNRGDKLDRGITLRDLTDAGIVTLRPGFLNQGGRITPIGGIGSAISGAYEPDLTPPPTPTNFTATAAISHIMVRCDPQLYLAGHGHAKSVLYGASYTVGQVYASGGTYPVFTDAVVLEEFSGTVFSHATNPATTWHLWLKWVTVDGVPSTNPAGGTNGYVATTGQDVALLLTALTNQVTTSQLYSTLGARINLIDTSGTGLVDQMVAAKARLDAVDTPVTGLIQKMADANTRLNAVDTPTTGLVAKMSAAEARLLLVDAPTTGLVDKLVVTNSTATTAASDAAAALASIVSINNDIAALQGLPIYSAITPYAVGEKAKYDGGIYQATETTTGNLPTNTSFWTKIGDYVDTTALSASVSAHETRITTVEGQTTALTSQSSALTAAVGANASTILDEANTRATDDQASAARISAMAASAGANASGLQLEQTVRADALASLSGQVTTLAAASGTNLAGLTLEQSTRADAQSALAGQVSTLVARTGDNLAGLVLEQGTRSDATSALATQLVTLGASSGAAAAALTLEQTTRADATGALASQIATLAASTGQSIAGITSEQQARSTDTGALATQTTALVAQVSGLTSTKAAITYVDSVVATETAARAASTVTLNAAIGLRNSNFKQRAVPTALAVGDLWVDEGSVNLLNWSEDFSDAVWAKPLATVSSDAAMAPDGTLTADQVTLHATGSGDDMYYALAGLTPGANYVFSTYIRLGTCTNLDICINNQLAWDSVHGEKQYTAADGLNTNTFTRIVHPFVCPAAGAVNIHLGKNNEPGLATQSAGTIFLWGAQLEAGTGAGRYIPTTTASVSTVGNNQLLVWDGANWVLSDDQRLAASAAGLQVAQQAIADETSARSAQTTTLTANTAANAAALVLEQTARTNATSSLSSQVSTLAAATGANVSGVTSEQQARTTDATALASRVDAISASTATGSAIIQAAQLVSSDADSSLASQVTDVVAKTGSNTAGLIIEQTARTDDASALSGQLMTLGASVGTSFAGLVVAQDTRADADSALATQLTTLGAVTGSNAAGVMGEQSARTTDASALASQVNTLLAATGTNTALMQVTQSASTSSTASLAGQLTTLKSSLDGNLAGLQVAQTTRSDADTALASQVTTVIASTGGNTAGLVVAQQVSTTADAALASQLSTLAAVSGANVAGITLAQSAAATADVAMASQVTTLQSTVGGHTAAISTESSTRATQTGELYAQYTVKTDVAGLVSGYGLASTANNAAPSSAFGVRANQFFIAPPATVSSTAPTVDLYDGYCWLDTSVTPNVTKYRSGATWSLVSPVLPFVVQATPTTINGVAVPAGIYASDLYVRNGTITNLKIANAAIDDAKIVNLSATKLTTGTLDAARIAANSITAGLIDARGLSIKDAAGNVILSSGSALQSQIAPYASGATVGATAADMLAAANDATAKANAVGDVVLYQSAGAAHAINGNSVVNLSSNSWESVVASRNSFTSDAHISYKPRTSAYYITGLSTGPTNGPTALSYSFIARSDNTVNCRELGAETALTTYVDGDLLEIIYWGTTVQYLKNGVVLRSVTATAGQKFYFECSVVTGQLDAIRFTPLTSNDWASVGGTGKPADNATVGASFGVNIGGQITSANASTYIADLAVNTLQIAGNAVTLPAGAINASDIAIGVFNTPIDIVSVSINSGGNPIFVTVTFTLSPISGSSSPYSLDFYLQIAGVTLQVAYLLPKDWSLPFTLTGYSASPGTGNIVCRLYTNTGTSDYVGMVKIAASRANIFAIGTKK